MFLSYVNGLLREFDCARLLLQDDYDDAHKISLVNAIDDRLYDRRIDGHLFEDMPPNHEAYRPGLLAIADHLYEQPYRG